MATFGRVLDPGLTDARDNQRAAAKIIRKLAVEIASGKFDYEARFPDSRNLDRLSLRSTPVPGRTPEFRRLWRWRGPVLLGGSGGFARLWQSTGSTAALLVTPCARRAQGGTGNCQEMPVWRSRIGRGSGSLDEAVLLAISSPSRL